MYMLGSRAKKLKFIKQFNMMFEDNEAINLDLLEDFPGKSSYIERMVEGGMVSIADSEALEKQRDLDEKKMSATEQEKLLEEHILG